MANQIHYLEESFHAQVGQKASQPSPQLP
uniref:Uncharacterized protein n=1 Tax=Rhizophora mucronata TaxID=61149 RepID=A0A2P2P8P9_RHIMU